MKTSELRQLIREELTSIKEESGRDLEWLKDVAGEIGSGFDWDSTESFNDDGSSTHQFSLDYYFETDGLGEDLDIEDVIDVIKNESFNDRDWKKRPMLPLIKYDEGYYGIIENPENNVGYSFVSYYKPTR